MGMARSRWQGILVLTPFWQRQLPDHVSKALLRDNGQFEIPGVVQGFFGAKAQRFGAIGGDACGCRNPLGGASVGTFCTCRLRVKTFDRLVSPTAAQ
jgi:hypothetical protein